MNSEVIGLPRSAAAEAAPASSISGRTADLFVPPVVVFLASRLLLFTLAWAAPRIIPRAHHSASFLPHSDPLAAAWAWSSPWFRFDARWYVGVAQHGYHWGSLGQANTNFLPLYPLLIRLLTPLTLRSPWLASWLLANLAFLAALILLWRWALHRWEKAAALRVLLLTALFPFGFFYAAPYAESLFVLLALAAFVFAEEDRWELAPLAAGLSTVARPVGLAVVLALATLAISHRQFGRMLSVALSLAPLLAFIAYLSVAFGQPLGFLTYHSAGWVSPHGGLLTTLTSQFHTHLSPFDRIDAALAMLFLASGIIAWRRLGPAYGVYVLLGALLPLVHGLVSMERYVIVLFPVMAVWASWRSRWGFTALFAISIMGLVLFTTMFAAGYAIF